MSATVRKLHAAPLTAVELLRRIHVGADEGQTGEYDLPSFAEAKSKFERELRKHPSAQSEVNEFFMLHSGEIKVATTPKPERKVVVTTDAEKAARALERQARRIRLASEVEAVVEKRIMMKFIMPNGKPLAECTMGYVGSVGGKFAKLGGKPSDKRLFGKVRTERDLEKAKI